MITATHQSGGMVPLNPTSDAYADNSTITLDWTNATSVAIPATTKSILIVPHISPTTTIYIRYTFGANTALTASATNYDRVLTPTYPSLQEEIQNNCTYVSLFSATASTIISAIQI